MDSALYLALNAAEQTMLAMQANTHNLANASTSGFRADMIQFNSEATSENTNETRIFSVAEAGIADLTPGTVITTGNPLDIAITGAGWIGVQSLTGEEAYTRNGEFQLTPEGQLVTSSGEFVLGNGGPIAIPPAETIDIANDGTISIRPLGAPADTLAVIDRIKLVNPPEDDLIKSLTGSFSLKGGGAAEFDETVRIVSGATESSNVNTVEALVNMIVLARQHDMQLNMIKTLKENDEISAQIMQS